MLTAGAENALLKTLEEPPAHVTWVLATTEPHKVVQTIRSRCQVFELGLVSSDIMADHLRYVVADAGLDADDEAIDHAVASGGGSVRDTLTALERVVAGGGTGDLDSSTDAILVAIAEGDRAGALSAVGDAIGRGRDPRTIGEMALAGLRDAFLTRMGDPPDRLSEHERARAADLAGRMAPAAITRSLETLGRALIDMRQAPDPRIDIEVALVRLCQPDEDRSLEALAQRVRQLEARLDGSAGSAPPAPGPAAARSEPPTMPAALPPTPDSAAREAHSEQRAAAPAAPAAPAPAPASTGGRASAAREVLSEQRAAAPAASAAPTPASASGGGRASAARRALEEQRASAAPGPAPPAFAPVTAGDPAPSVPPPVPTPDLASIRPRSPTEVVELARRHLSLEQPFVVTRAKDLAPDRDRRRDPAQLQALWQDLLQHARGAPAVRTPAAPTAGADAVVALPQDEPVPAPGLEDRLELQSGEPSQAGASGSDAAVTLPRDEPAPGLEHRSEQQSGVSMPGESPPPAEPDGGLAPPDLDDEMESFDPAELDALEEAPSHAHDIEKKIRSAFPGTEFAVLPDPDDDPGESVT